MPLDAAALTALAMILAAPFVGSFLGVVADRLPAGRPIVWGRSVCGHCGATLSWRDLVPLVSWALTRGRCRHCAAPLGLFYPAIELGALAVAFWSLAVLPGWLAVAGGFLGWTLMTLAVIDARHMILPDGLTLPLIPAGLAVAWLIDPARLVDHLAGAAVGFGAIVGLAAAYRRLRGREGIGLGDAKLLAAAGAWVSWEGLAGVLLLAAGGGLAGALVARLITGRLSGQDALPFGPYLAGGFWLVWLYGPIVLG